MKCADCPCSCEIKNIDDYDWECMAQSEDIEIWGVDWFNGDLFCPNYLKCGNHPFLRTKTTESEEKK